MLPCDALPHLHKPHSSTNSYGGQTSEKAIYAFNSLGYRCEEYKPEARFQIGIIGASDTLGLGVEYQQSFGFQLKQLIAELYGLAIDDICLTNFSAAGVSNNYCSRTVFQQIPDYRPDLFIYDIVQLPRSECLDKGQVFPVAFYANDERSLAFLDLYTPQSGFAELLKNILLIQCWLRQHDVPYIIANGIVDFFADSRLRTCQGFYKAIDFSRVMDHDYRRLQLDATDEVAHLGPIAHKAIAIELFEFYGKMQGAVARQKAQKLVAAVKSSDAHWQTAEKARRALTQD